MVSTFLRLHGSVLLLAILFATLLFIFDQIDHIGLAICTIINFIFGELVIKIARHLN